VLLADIGNALTFFQANLLYIISIQHRLPFAVCIGVALRDADLRFSFNKKPSSTLTGPHFSDSLVGS